MFCFIRLDELENPPWQVNLFVKAGCIFDERMHSLCLCDFLATFPYIQGSLRFNPSPPSPSDEMGTLTLHSRKNERSDVA